MQNAGETKQTSRQRYTDGQQAPEKTLDIISPQGDANQTDRRCRFTDFTSVGMATVTKAVTSAGQDVQTLERTHSAVK